MSSFSARASKDYSKSKSKSKDASKSQSKSHDHHHHHHQKPKSKRDCPRDICDIKRQHIGPSPVKLDCQTDVHGKVRFPIEIKLKDIYCVSEPKDHSWSGSTCDVVRTYCDASVNFCVKEDFTEVLKGKADVRVFKPQIIKDRSPCKKEHGRSHHKKVYN